MCSYCGFDQINSALVSIRGFFQNKDFQKKLCLCRYKSLLNCKTWLGISSTVCVYLRCSFWITWGWLFDRCGQQSSRTRSNKRESDETFLPCVKRLHKCFQFPVLTHGNSLQSDRALGVYVCVFVYVRMRETWCKRWEKSQQCVEKRRKVIKCERQI